MVPVLAGKHVISDTGTGFVHTAPSHGQEDFDVWHYYLGKLKKIGVCTKVPFTVDDDGRFTDEAPGFSGSLVVDKNGNIESANKLVIDELSNAGALASHSTIRHKYPHSWRSKKPVIYRNTPQWFVSMDKCLPTIGEHCGTGSNSPAGKSNMTLRELALSELNNITFYPSSGRNRLKGMLVNKPDWVLSRQRAWGVPVAIFRNMETGVIAPGPDFAASTELKERIRSAFILEGTDSWFYNGSKNRFLDGLVDDQDAWEQVLDILDVWFDSGSSHLVCSSREALSWPADMYLEGSDQHRGWFQSSLLVSCCTKGSSPCKRILTHGFVLDENGHKMSKSIGNVINPADVIGKFGVDVLRLWAITSDFLDDLRISNSIIQSSYELYRKVRITLRWILGCLKYFDVQRQKSYADFPSLEKYILHRLYNVSNSTRAAYEEYDFREGVLLLIKFITADLSSFYFDIRKDSLYCDPVSSSKRNSALTVLSILFASVVKLLAPILPFLTEEAWRCSGKTGSVHLERFPEVLEEWNNPALASKWDDIRNVRRVITGSIEAERLAKRIGSSLEASISVYTTDQRLLNVISEVDFAEIAITSSATIVLAEGPEYAFRLDDVAGVSVVTSKAKGRKCARSWKISDKIGSDPEYPDITPRDAEAVRELLRYKHV